MVNLLITGPNYFNDYNAVASKLSEIGVDKQECTIVTSLSTGVDTMAFDYGVANNKEVIVYNIQDDEDTKMYRTVTTATHAIVIWDGLDKKTHKMLQLVNAYKLKLIEIRM